MRLQTQRAVRRGRFYTLAALFFTSCLLSQTPLSRAEPHAVQPPGGQQGALSRPGATPNLIVVTIDTLRADHLGSYGYTDIETPNLDRLAAQGVRFDQAATTTPLTLPAHASILTGQYPFRHGVRDNLNFRLADKTSTLADVLHSTGYATAAFVGASVLDIRTGIGQGFDTYSDPSRPVVPSRLRTPLQVERRGDEVVAEALSWIAGVRSPFFTWVHLFDPHAPYLAPAPFRDRYNGRAYDGEIAYVDHVIGDLMSGLGELGHGADTVVALTSDHGEGLGDHREELHSLLVYDSTARVPLIIWAPGRLPAGAVVNSQVSVVDVMPTVLTLLGVQDPEPGSRDGTDLQPLVAEPDAAGTSAYVESMLPLLQFGWSELRAVRRNGFKYILAPQPELYDLRKDPDENCNLIDQQPELAEALRAELAELTKLDNIDDLGLGRRFVDTQLEARIRNLRALGYVGGLASPSSGPPGDPKDDVEMLESFQRDALGTERALANERWSEADVYIEALATRLPEHPMVYFYRGRARLGQGRNAEAIAALERAVSLGPANTLAWLDLAKAHRAGGDKARAGEVLASAERAFPSLAIFPLSRGYNLQQDGRYEEAERAYLAATTLAPLDPTALRRLANLYLESRDLEKAASTLAELVAAEPDAADAWSSLADVRCALDQMASCEAARYNAIVSAPDRADLHSKLGETLLQRENQAEAVEMFRQALRLDPGQRHARDALNRLGLRDGGG